MHRRRIGRRGKRNFKVFAVVFVLLVLILAADNSIRPLAKTLAQSRAKLESERAVNDAIAEVLSEGEFYYNDLVTVTSLPDGEMSSISTNVVKVNMLKAEVHQKIQERIKNGEPGELKIPVGSLCGSQFLTGRGPKISLKMNFYGNVFTDLQSKFTEAGINQTRHQIILTVRMSVFIEMPGYKTSTEVKTNFCVAETVIVGRVPDSYTVVNGDESPPVSLINDYGNNS